MSVPNIITAQDCLPDGRLPTRRAYAADGMMICPDCDGRCVVPSRNPDREQWCPTCHGEGQIERRDEDLVPIDAALLAASGRMWDMFFRSMNKSTR